MKSIFRRSTLFAMAIAICFGISFSCGANVGGGSGRAQSPYLDNIAAEDAADVRGLKTQDAKGRFVNFHTPSGRFIYGTQIGAAYARAEPTPSATETAFTGTVEGESVPRAVDFSVIRYVTVLNKDSDTIALKLDLFPDISVDALLKERPSYTTLKERYTKSIAIRLPARSKAGQPLALIGRDAEKNSPLRIVVILGDLSNGLRFEFMGDNLWWATGSVTDDLAYPHRVIIKK